MCAEEITCIKFLWPSLFFAKHNKSCDESSPSKITLIDEPDIGFIPAASHLLKNFTMANIFDLSVKATDGILFFWAQSTIWLMVKSPWEMLNSDEILRCEKIFFINMLKGNQALNQIKENM